ncbi:uncharacterized protein LOC103722416 [Phoenix dactylifera]|uniref:Uncharacterized protein LOC103722416 n=1 Tax=Phoenix dactylifera TaxID=42345 RepID=A0A8B7D1E4_PHODC|nr:uncharacterized protein LOC103722416 [Phoenix dactylifera]
MYATRLLSVFKNSPDAGLQPPPEGPNSGYLVLQDEGPEIAEPTCCWGLCKDTRVRDLPFPQNRILTIEYTQSNGETTSTYTEVVIFVPVMDQPLSSNRYYVILVKGKHKGKALTCSKEEDKTTCCFCRCVKDVKPKPFDHRNIYQQMEIVGKKGSFTAKSVASDGYPPWLLRRKYWKVYASKPNNYSLSEASGRNKSVHARPPELHFPISAMNSPKMAVGKWYIPFVFVKENGSFEEQMKLSMFYEMTLEQYWEEAYTCENSYGERKVVEVNSGVRPEIVLLNGKEAKQDVERGVDGVLWFKPLDSMEEGIGLSSAIWERMRWEENRGGWVAGEEKVERVEEYGGVNGWRKFSCYVLVERFALKRMDGSLPLIFDFRHTNKISTKWE